MVWAMNERRVKIKDRRRHIVNKVLRQRRIKLDFVETYHKAITIVIFSNRSLF